VTRVLGAEEEGISLLETLVALLLLAMVAQGGWTVLAQHRFAASDVSFRAEGLETVRTIGWLLREEASYGRPDRDWWVDGSDSLTLRAFRGAGLVRAGETEDDQIRVCFRGIRSPNPEKDSVLVLGKDGRWSAHGLQGRARTHEDCPGLGGGWEEEWTLSPEPPEAVLGRVFERGSYHLVNGALRYRRGGAGRQPLTPERVGVGRFVRLWSGGRSISWEVELTPIPVRPDSVLWRGRVW
jgi:hypothetical protein